MLAREQMIDLYEEGRYNNILHFVRRHGTMRMKHTDRYGKQLLSYYYNGLVFDFITKFDNVIRMDIR